MKARTGEQGWMLYCLILKPTALKDLFQSGTLWEYLPRGGQRELVAILIVCLRVTPKLRFHARRKKSMSHNMHEDHWLSPHFLQVDTLRETQEETMPL